MSLEAMTLKEVMDTLRAFEIATKNPSIGVATKTEILPIKSISFDTRINLIRIETN